MITKFKNGTIAVAKRSSAYWCKGQKFSVHQATDKMIVITIIHMNINHDRHFVMTRSQTIEVPASEFTVEDSFAIETLNAIKPYNFIQRLVVEIIWGLKKAWTSKRI